MIRGPIHTVGEFPRNVWRPGTRCGKRLAQWSRVVRVNGKRVTIARERPGENFAVAHPTYKRRASFLGNLRFFLPLPHTNHLPPLSRTTPLPSVCPPSQHSTLQWIPHCHRRIRTDSSCLTATHHWQTGHHVRRTGVLRHLRSRQRDKLKRARPPCGSTFVAQER